MDYATIYKKTEQYVTDLFNREQDSRLSFHNLDHTEYVVNKTKEIAGHYELTEKDMLVVFIAAWFHDTGYLFVPAPRHEEKSVELMKHFAEEYHIPEDIVTDVEACILITKRTEKPANLLEQIISDADTYNFGTNDFKKTNKLVFKEWQNLNPTLFKPQFDAAAIKMLEHHEFYTSYCKELLNETKTKNMKKLHKKAAGNEDAKSEKKGETKNPKKTQEAVNTSISEKAGTTKGMQTMLRLTSSNHIQLSEMADSKANILISVNAIIISVILSVLLRKLQTDPYLTIPTLIFLAAAVITIVIAILATRPKLNEGTFVEEDVRNKKTNLLFFGNFHKMSQKDYEDAMRVMMTDADYLYSSMVQDIYHLGTVLGRKYKLIRLAYTIFMVGIVVSVIAFGLAAVFYSPVENAVPTSTSGSPF
jgi:HD superfamily phosphodiesterase